MDKNCTVKLLRTCCIFNFPTISLSIFPSGKSLIHKPESPAESKAGTQTFTQRRKEIWPLAKVCSPLHFHSSLPRQVKGAQDSRPRTSCLALAMAEPATNPGQAAPRKHNEGNRKQLLLLWSWGVPSLPLFERVP